MPYHAMPGFALPFHVMPCLVFEHAILDKYWELCRNISHNILAGEKHARKAVGACLGINAQKVEST
jgi:hypothetical protein